MQQQGLPVAGGTREIVSEYPKAQMSVGESAAIPTKTFDSVPTLGLGTTDHVLPS
jgi:hypothetical protein